MQAPPLLLLGVGTVALSVADQCASTHKIIGTTRQPEKVFDLFHESIEPVVMPWPSAEIIAPLADGADVLVSFPPDGTTDAILAPACLNARSLVYISSTSVFGKREGKIDDTTPVDEESEGTQRRIEAEKIWRSIGGNVLRVPGFYNCEHGLHKRLREGSYKIPGDGSRMVSRIHLDDLAAIIIKLLSSGKQGETYVVGDLQPAPHKEVVGWLCEQMGLPMPESAPLESQHYTLRGNRAVDPQRALKELNITLKYPSYKEGYEACLHSSAASE